MSTCKYSYGLKKVLERGRLPVALIEKNTMLSHDVSKQTWHRWRYGVRGVTFWFRGDSGFLRLNVEGRWADSLASDCEGLADRLALYFPCCLGFREAGGGDCRGQFRGCNLDLNNAIISFRFLKNNTALHNKKKGTLWLVYGAGSQIFF